MTVIPAGTFKVETSDTPYTDMRRRGSCDGGYLEWDSERRRWRGYVDPDPEATASGSNHGITYIPGVGAVLAWRTEPRDIDESEWVTSESGKFAVVRPPGAPSQTRLHQFSVEPGESWFAVREGWPAAKPFCVSLYREATPKREETVNEDDLPYYYTAVRFGGRYELRLPKWRQAELWKAVKGEWRRVLQMPWRHAELYNDSHSQQEMFVTCMPLDGMVLLFQSNYTDEPVTYVEEKPISIGQAAIEIHGNGGGCYLGLHDVVFSTDTGNYLVADGPLQTVRTLGTMPGSTVLGSKPAGCVAELELVGADGNEITPAEITRRWNTWVETHPDMSTPMPIQYRRRLHLQTDDASKTPVVRFAAIVGAPELAKTAPAWTDISSRVQSVDGGWTVDLKRRLATQEYTVQLDNADGALRQWLGNKRGRVSLGYADAPANLAVRADAYMYLLDDDVQNLAVTSVRAQTLDRMNTLFEIECGYREPQDGRPVAEAIATALGWGGVYVNPNRWSVFGFAGGAGPYSDEVGLITVTGRRIPTSRFAAEAQLAERGLAVAGQGSDESRAVAQPEPTQSVGDFIVYLMQFDYATLAWFDTDARFYYRTIGDTATTHHLFETESASFLDAIRGSFTARTRAREMKTSVVVTGRDRATREPIVVTLSDPRAIADATATGFVGYDRTARITDERLNSLAMCTKRARWEYQMERAIGRQVSFECSGQPRRFVLERMVPHETRSRGGNRTYLITGVKDVIGTDRQYHGQIDGVDLDDALGVVGAS